MNIGWRVPMMHHTKDKKILLTSTFVEHKNNKKANVKLSF
jgi:hypothetical protein